MRIMRLTNKTHYKNHALQRVKFFHLMRGNQTVLRYTYTGKEIRTFKKIQLNWSRRGLKQ